MKAKKSVSSAMCNFTVRLDRKLQDEITQVSSSQNMTRGEVIRMAINDSLSRMKIYKFDEKQTKELIDRITELEQIEIKLTNRENQLINSLKHVGNNINQIARGVNQNHCISNEELATVKKTINAYEQIRKEAMKTWQLLSKIYQRMERKLSTTSKEKTAKDTTDTKSEMSS